MIRYKIPCLALLVFTLFVFVSISSCSKDADVTGRSSISTDISIRLEQDPVTLALNPTINSSLTTSDLPLVTETEYLQSTTLEKSLIDRVQSQLNKLMLYQELPTAIPDRILYTNFYTTSGGIPVSIIGPPPTGPDNHPITESCRMCSPASAYNCIMGILLWASLQGLNRVNITIFRLDNCVFIKWGSEAVLNPPIGTGPGFPTNP